MGDCFSRNGLVESGGLSPRTMQHRSISACSVLAFLACAGALSAQGTHTISPAGLANVYGGNTTGYPWGYGTTYPAFRYQQIHDDLAGVPRVILGLAVRRKESGANWPALAPTLQLDLSDAAVPSQAATATFTSNHGANRTVAMTAKIVNFPAVNTPTNGLPAPFTYVMMLDQPYVHTGATGICWECILTATNYTGTTLNLDLAQNGSARNVAYGTGCAGATLAGTYLAPTLTQSASGLTPSTNAVLIVGANADVFAGLKLPLDLGIVNAAGCSLYLDPLVSVGLVVDGAGAAANTINTTGLPGGIYVYFQVVAPSASVPLGLAFSNGLYQTPSAPATYMRNWVSSTSAVNGSLQKTYALVTDFIQP